MHKWIFVFALATLVGCGEQAAENIVENAVELAAASQGESIDVDINADGASISVETDKGSVSVNTGANARIPEGFPEDIPIHPAFNIQNSTTFEDSTFSLQGDVNDGLDTVKAYYDKEFDSAGWTQANSVDQEQMFMRTYESGERGVSVTGMTLGEKTGLSVTVAPLQ